MCTRQHQMPSPRSASDARLGSCRSPCCCSCSSMLSASSRCSRSASCSSFALLFSIVGQSTVYNIARCSKHLEQMVHAQCRMTSCRAILWCAESHASQHPHLVVSGGARLLDALVQYHPGVVPDADRCLEVLLTAGHPAASYIAWSVQGFLASPQSPGTLNTNNCTQGRKASC